MLAHTDTDVTQNRHGCENALSRKIQNRTDYFEILRKLFIFTSLKKRKPRTYRSAVKCSITELYTPYQRTFALRYVGRNTKMLCLEIYRTGHIIPAFKILKNIFSFSSMKKGASGFELGTSRSTIKCSITELYTPYQRTFALRSVGRNTKMLCLEIYRTGQIIPAFEILRNIFSFSFMKKGHLGLNWEPLDLQSNALSLSYTTRISEHLLCVP
ncbi:hypothetical protein TNCV_1278101 [Trichonephila clavipes]|nr:hypothetical protein TNCV_1278101 [Trichonephila clavipes]